MFPIAIPVAMAAVSLLGGAAGASAAQQQGQALADIYKQQGVVAQAQAKNQAAQELDKYKRIAGAQRAAYGASGVDVNVGSPLDVLADTDAEGKMSAMQILYSGELQEWNSRQGARMALLNAQGQATGSLLGGLVGGLGALSRIKTG